MKHTTAIILMAMTFGASAQCGPETAPEPEPVETATPAPPPPFALPWGPVTLACVAETEESALCEHEATGSLRCYAVPETGPQCWGVEEDDARIERRRAMLEAWGL